MKRGTYLLDTSIAIDLLRGDPLVERRWADADEVTLNLVVAGELCFGAEGSIDPQERVKVEEFLATIAVLADDLVTARTYAILKDDLRRRGEPVPDNDLWIAASPLRHGMTLATRDRHFDVVAGLSVDRWE